MKKSPEAFRTISEVAETLDVPPHVLRFWETRFTQIKPVKRGGGRRYYRPEDVSLLRGIKGLLYDEGMTIKGAQKILREKGIRHVIGLGSLPNGEAEAAPVAARKPMPEPKAKPAEAGPKPESRPVPAPAAPRPQADLFEVATGPRGADAATTLRPIDKSALRDLVGRLVTLRAEMLADPPK
jgi:DNA-binding transcriptional MerR regulator